MERLRTGIRGAAESIARFPAGRWTGRGSTGARARLVRLLFARPRMFAAAGTTRSARLVSVRLLILSAIRSSGPTFTTGGPTAIRGTAATARPEARTPTRSGRTAFTTGARQGVRIPLPSRTITQDLRSSPTARR